MATLIDILAESAQAWWPCYNLYMEIVNFPQQNFNLIGSRGECPHCRMRSYFGPVGGLYAEPVPGGGFRACQAVQCEACKDFVLVVARRTHGQGPFRLEGFAPLGTPDDSVDQAVPPAIRSDFAEALRCRWVKAYKATVVLCRRAIQSSCLELKAQGRKLVDQIDELGARGIITDKLREFAHEVRLTGNTGAHPKTENSRSGTPADGESLALSSTGTADSEPQHEADELTNVTENDAEDIIEFTREYFHHVYVMPARLDSRQKARGQRAGT